MFVAFRRAGLEGAVYGVGQALQGAIGFLLVPIYTRSMSQSDFGKLGILLSIGAIVGIIVSVGLNSAIFRSYFDYEDETDRQMVIGTTLLLLMLMSLIVMFVSIPLLPVLSQILFAETTTTVLLWFVIIKGVASSFVGTPLAVYRARGYVKKFVIITSATSVFKVSVITFLVLGANQGLIGVVLGDAITSVVASLVLLWTIRGDISMKFSMVEARKLLTFGVPLVPADLASMVFSRADLFFLNQFTNLAVVGQYTAAMMIVQAIQMLIKTPLMLMWTPMILSVEKSAFAKEFYARISVYLLLILGCLTLVIFAFSSEIIFILVGPGYELATQVLPILCLAQVFYIIQITFSSGITLKRKTQFVPLIVVIAAAASLIANTVMVPRWEIMGAAFAGLLSAAVFMIATYYFSQSVYQVPYDWNRMAKVVFLFGTSCTLIYLAGILTETFFAEEVYSQLIVLAIVVIFSIIITLYSLDKIERTILWQKSRCWLLSLRLTNS